MTKAAKACIFWGTRNVSKEHVWSEWIAKAIIRETTNCRDIAGSSNAKPPMAGPKVDRIRHRQSDHRESEMRLPAALQRWLDERAEQHCKPFLLPMILGGGVDQTASQRSDIAAWCALKTMVYEYTHRPTARVIPADQHHWLYEHRDQRLAPPQMQIRLAAYHGEAQEAGLGWQRLAAMRADGFDVGDLQLHHTTVTLGHLVMQVVGFVPTQWWMIGHPFATGCAATKTWPPDSAGSKKWPPARWLNDTTIHCFADVPEEIDLTFRTRGTP